MDVVAMLVLSSFVWLPAVVIAYWVIRLAVRHGVEDAHRLQRQADMRAETIRRERAT